MGCDALFIFYFILVSDIGRSCYELAAQVFKQLPEFSSPGIRHQHLDQPLALVKGGEQGKPVIALKDKPEKSYLFWADQKKILQKCWA